MEAQPVTIETLFNKLCALEERLDKPSVEKGLWDTQDIANFCGLSYNHTYSHIITDPRFPAPVDISGKFGSKNSKKLFMRNEVIRFFETHKKKKYRA